MVAAVQNENRFIKTLPTLVEGEGLEKLTRLMAASSKTVVAFVPKAPLKGLVKVTGSAKEFLCGLHLFERIHEWTCTPLLQQNRNKIASRSLLTVAHAIDTVGYFGNVLKIYDLGKLVASLGKAFPVLTPILAFVPILTIKNSCVLGSAVFSLANSSNDLKKVDQHLAKMQLSASRVDTLKGAIGKAQGKCSEKELSTLKANAKVLGYREVDLESSAQLDKIALYSINQYELDKQKTKKTWIAISADIAKMAIVTFATVLLFVKVGSLAIVGTALTLCALNNEIFGMLKFLSREALFTKIPQMKRPESLAQAI